MLHAMLERNRRVRNSDESGFTLVEILAAVVIIGILATLAILKIISVINNSHDTAAKNEVAAIRTAESSYLTVGADGKGDSGASYAPLTGSNSLTSSAVGFGQGGDVSKESVVFTDNSQTSYTVYVQSKTGTIWVGTDKNGQVVQDPNQSSDSSSFPVDGSTAAYPTGL